MPKFAVYSDLHMHSWEYGAATTDLGYNSRLYMQSLFLMNLGAYCKKESINNLFFCGDFFHTHGRLSASAMFLAHKAVRYIYSQGINQFMLVGNHDISISVKKTTIILEPNSIEPFSMMSNVISSPVIGRKLSDLDIFVSMLPYTQSESQLKNRLAAVSAVITGGFPHFLFLHQGVASVPLGSGYLIDEILKPDMIPSNVTRAFTGHYHTHKDLGKLVIVGPPMQHTWADKNEEGGILIVDSITGEFTRETSMVSSPKFVETGASFLKLAAHLDGDDSVKKLVLGNFIRIKGVTSSLEEAEAGKQALLTAGAASVELVFLDKESPQLNVDCSNISMEEILEIFSKELSPREIEIGEELRKGSYAVPSL